MQRSQPASSTPGIPGRALAAAPGQASETNGGEQRNLELVIRAGEVLASGFDAPHEGLFADDFVFRYFNSRLPELSGDHHGLAGMQSFFERLQAVSDGSFRVEPISLTPFGEELVAAHATITLSVADSDLELDALVVWRVFGGQIHEAWDIPCVNTTRVPRPGPAQQDSRS